mgnify:FL=1
MIQLENMSILMEVVTILKEIVGEDVKLLDNSNFMQYKMVIIPMIHCLKLKED